MRFVAQYYLSADALVCLCEPQALRPQRLRFKVPVHLDITCASSMQNMADSATTSEQLDLRVYLCCGGLAQTLLLCGSQERACLH